ncbi:MAG: hypothetical protein M3Y69_05770, partial [Verrucomicrobiota bacterium]|nr:hypothetical protein [Verrucomicrobiota bacterium]
GQTGGTHTNRVYTGVLRSKPRVMTVTPAAYDRVNAADTARMQTIATKKRRRDTEARIKS